MLLTGPFAMLSMPLFDFHLPPCTEGFLIHLSSLWQLPLFPSVAQFPCVASIGARGRVPPLTEKIVKNREKEGEIGKKRGKSEKNRQKTGKNWKEKAKNREDSFTLPLLTKRAGYATD